MFFKYNLEIPTPFPAKSPMRELFLLANVMIQSKIKFYANVPHCLLLIKTRKQACRNARRQEEFSGAHRENVPGRPSPQHFQHSAGLGKTALKVTF